MIPVICQGAREAGKDHLDSLGGTREAPGGRKGLIGQPADSLGGTREAPGMQKRTNWTACEAPGRHQQERTIWTATEAPGG